MNPIYIAIPLVLLIGVLIFVSDQYTSLEIVMFLVFMIIIGIIGTQYFLGVSLTATLQDLFNKPEVDISIVQKVDEPDPEPSVPVQPKRYGKKQVYHVNGRFNFADAKTVCKSYNAKLATIEEMMHAYDEGAEWCNYGWSDGHMALYPTQYKSWKSYQETGNPEQCGRPGINGGYNNRLFQKLGANCFGKKPPQNGPLPPPPIQQKIVDERVQYWQNQNLKVSPFNYNEWSE
jgi:hypothetical protein